MCTTFVKVATGKGKKRELTRADATTQARGKRPTHKQTERERGRKRGRDRMRDRMRVIQRDGRGDVKQEIDSKRRGRMGSLQREEESEIKGAQQRSYDENTCSNKEQRNETSCRPGKK